MYFCKRKRIEFNSSFLRTKNHKIKYHDFEQVTRSITVAHSFNNKETILNNMPRLLAKTDIYLRPIRLIGIGLSNLTGGDIQAGDKEQGYIDQENYRVESVDKNREQDADGIHQQEELYPLF